MIWIDGHDVPFSGYLNAIFFEGYKSLQQEITDTNDRAHPYVYKGSDTRARLNALGDDARDPCFGITLIYEDQLTGKDALPTMRCRISRLTSGEETTLHRRTANLIYHVVSGSGATLAGDRELAWREGDLFVVPGWTWHQHCAQSPNAVLFSMSDEPVADAFGLLRIQTKEN